MAKNYRGDNLIFIISQPRSGSTLLQRVLSGHPEIQTSAETWLMLHPVYATRGSGIETEYGASFAAEGVNEFIKNYAANGDIYDEAIRNWAETIYNDALNKQGKSLFLDKTPRYFFIIPELYRLFPEAKFIFLIRNPMAVLASELTTYVKGNWPVLGVFQPDLLLAPRLILEGIELLGSDAITIHYEKFVSEPEKNISALCKQLGISFNDSMLDYSRTPAPKGKMNDPIGIHKHTRPSTASMEKWKRMADNIQSRHFARSYLDALGPETIEQLGYSWEQIRRDLDETDTHSSKQELLFPWSIAIRPQKEWTAREHYFAEKYFAVQKKGRLKGTLSAIKRNIKRLLRDLKKQLTLPAPPDYR
ncbi:MAG TPA: sulfotransferase [Gammaproteobacteria bacterium]|nr:sulfotransferase [Gammaproteobacteria bacterium]